MTRDLVRKILIADPNMRLEIKDIMKHKFFAGVNWDSVSDQQLDPPYIPADQSISDLLTPRGGSTFREKENDPINKDKGEKMPPLISEQCLGQMQSLKNQTSKTNLN